MCLLQLSWHIDRGVADLLRLGLGYYGSLSRWQAWCLVPLVWVGMLLWSKPWLERFHYGPLEWAWRSLARGKMQPMRKTRATPATA
ncbi:DUF418 domain-containing protein [Sphingomonas daechungensis]|uniref:DUF418 domain-containing protein n=1 Tax=Sphingomonas daechungensis TaxID=1176646 RepID=A0ABX6T1W3_9SPHN|nr:DUF418 domain-containing protein [Sphingomonas daechungensis]QNP43685.1 DUF418 domain-containing protein [Sphingomonas daechungensis]